MSKNLYCALAFNSISFGPHGGNRPCCAVDTYFWKETSHTFPDYKNDVVKWFNNSDIVKLRQDLLDGKWNPICNLCKIREDVGQASTRQIFNNTLRDIEAKNQNWFMDTSYTVDTAEVNDLSKIFLLDVTVGNKCNSACIMCNASASSLWAKEQEEINGYVYKGLNLNWFSEEVIPGLVDNMPNLKAIQFAGGEPTISEPHFFLLRRLIEQGRSKDITLGYVTNLTGVKQELLDLWDKFSTKHITVSIDGVDKVNEYQRYPFSWDKVVYQLEKIKKMSAEKKDYHIGLSHTITSLNLLTFIDMVKWWENQVSQGCGILTSLPHVQCVTNPDHLDPIYMPKKMKQDGLLMLDQLEEYCDTNNILEKYKPAIDNIRTNVLLKEVDDEKQINMWEKMKSFIIQLDKYRNRNIFDYLPHMKEYW